MATTISRDNHRLLLLVAAFWIHLSAEVLACGVEGDIRLVNGSNKFEGRVEYCNDSEWKSICFYGFFEQEAAVACRQLGFSGNLNPTAALYEVNLNVFGGGSSDILRRNWRCSGMEDKLVECTTDEVPICGGDLQDRNSAGLYCFGKDYERCSGNEIRLVNGSEGQSGRVEVCIDGLWGTVCDDGWDVNDATAVCRQLGHNGTGIPTRLAYFGAGNGPIHVSRTQCTSRDIRLTDCRADRSGINGCVHGEDAGVICQSTGSCNDGDIRLVGEENEREGRVEICYNGVWGTVCDYGWDQVDASVVCTQLGYGHQGIATVHMGAGEGPILFNNVDCTKDHSALYQCVHPLSIGIHNCRREETAGVVCLNNILPSPTSTMMYSSTLESRNSSIAAAVPLESMSIQMSTEGGTLSSTDPDTRTKVILGAVCGVVFLGVVAAVVVMLLVIVVLKKNNSKISVKGSANNPSSAEGCLHTAAANQDEDEKEFQNPLYQSTDEKEFRNPLYHSTDIVAPVSCRGPATLTSPSVPIHENIYETVQDAMGVDPYGDADDYYSVPRALFKGWELIQASSGMANDTTSEAIYDLPPDVIDDACN